jgi:predicted dehydrogenase
MLSVGGRCIAPMPSAIIVGCGRMAGGGPVLRPDSYAAAIAADDSWVLLGGVDARVDRAREFAERHNCAWSDDLHTVLAGKRPDVVVIATPDSSHFATAREVLVHGSCPRVLVIEKPICQHPEEILELVKLSSLRSCLVAVNHSRRLDRRYANIRSAIRAGRFGQLRKARVVYYGGWRHNGIHVVDTLGFIFDSAPVWTNSGGFVVSRFPDDPTFHLTGTFANLGGSIEVEGVDESDYQLFEFDLRFSGGRVQITDFGARIDVHEVLLNPLGERVLVDAPFDHRADGRTTTAVLLDAVNRYLRTGKDSRLVDVGLDAATQSMHSLWQGGSIGEQD